MAYVKAPRDLTAIKSRLIFNLTKRQVVCFSVAGAIGFPVYLATHRTLGTHVSVLLMVVIMLPVFFIALYEKDGLPAEKILKYIIRQRMFHPAKRPYKLENQEGSHGAKKPAATPANRQQNGKRAKPEGG